MARCNDYIDENEDPTTGKNWSVLDVEDLRDYAKVMPVDDLAPVMMRSRHEIQKKLIELGISAVKGGAAEG